MPKPGKISSYNDTCEERRHDTVQIHDVPLDASKSDTPMWTNTFDELK